MKARIKKFGDVSVDGVLFGIMAVFLILKLLNIIQWSWWWVISPIWVFWGAIGLLAAYVVLEHYLRKAMYRIIISLQSGEK